MWKDSLVARFHKRTASFQAQGAPLIRSPGERPFSTATLDPVQEQEDDQPATSVAVTATSEKINEKPDSKVASKPDLSLAQAAADIESSNLLGMRSLRSFFMEEIDTAQAAAPLSAYCFMTGFMYVSCVRSASPRSPAHPLVMQCPFLRYSFGVPSRQVTLYKYVRRPRPLYLLSDPP